MAISTNTRSHLLLLCSTLIAGGNYTMVKTLIPTLIAPNGLILIRAASGAVFFFFLEKITVKEPAKIDQEDYLPILLSGLFGLTLNQLFFFNGMSITNPINGSIFNLINPITTVLFSAIYLKNKLNKYTILAVAVSLSGALLLLDFANFSSNESTFKGDVMVFINAIFFGLYVVLSIPLVKKYNAFVIVKLSFWIAFVVLFPLGIQDVIAVQWQNFTQDSWFSFAYIILLTTLLVYFLNFYLAGNTSAETIALYVYFQPFFAAIIAIALGKDELTLLKVSCGALLIFGIYLAQVGKRLSIQDHGKS